MKKDEARADDRAASAETTFTAYAEPLVGEAIAQASALEGAGDAEQLHKLRVALRRLRTLLWAYRPILNEDFDTQQRAVYKFLANAAGNTRDWDILIGLVQETGDSALLDAFRANRAEASRKSLETLAHASVKQILREAMSEANRELNTAAQRTPLNRFAKQRVVAAQNN